MEAQAPESERPKRRCDLGIVLVILRGECRDRVIDVKVVAPLQHNGEAPALWAG